MISEPAGRSSKTDACAFAKPASRSFTGMTMLTGSIDVDIGRRAERTGRASARPTDRARPRSEATAKAARDPVDDDRGAHESALSRVSCMSTAKRASTASAKAAGRKLDSRVNQ